MRPPANSCGNVASGEGIDPLATVKPEVPTDVANTLTRSRKPPVNFLPNVFPSETVHDSVSLEAANFLCVVIYYAVIENEQKLRPEAYSPLLRDKVQGAELSCADIFQASALV